MNIRERNNKPLHLFFSLFVMFLLVPHLRAEPEKGVTLNMRDVEIAQVMDLLSRQQRVNILLAKGVSGDVSVNLYNVEIDRAIRDIATAAGYAVEKRNNSYFIMPHSDVGEYSDSGTTQIYTFDVHYAQAENIAEILSKYLSKYGSITHLKDRNMIVVEDTPHFIQRIQPVMNALDRKPKQIMIEALILEITLEDSDAFGVQWNELFNNRLGDGTIGTAGFVAENPTGLFIDLSENDLQVFLDALHRDGRTRTLSTPKLLALEHQEASVIVGDRLGYLNTITINQVTTESTQFLESGVILRVTPSVDASGKILLDIEPEVSTGKVTDGIPSQTTTSVKTQLLVSDGHTTFIGGLIKTQQSNTVVGVPFLHRIPILGRFFKREEQRVINTETIVLITPKIIDSAYIPDSVRPLLNGGLEDISRHFKNANENLLPLAPTPLTNNKKP